MDKPIGFSTSHGDVPGQLSGNQCVRCLKKIEKNVAHISCQDNFDEQCHLYHESCFVCDGCKTPMYKTGSPWSALKLSHVGDRLLCQQCCMKILMQDCAGCQTPLTQHIDLVEISGRWFHQECFRCEVCKQVLRDVFNEYEGRYLCIDHYRNALARCARCNKVIMHSKVDNHGGSISMWEIEDGGPTDRIQYHSDCFTCHFCGESLGAADPVKVYRLDNEVCCKQCFYRRLPKSRNASVRNVHSHSGVCSLKTPSPLLKDASSKGKNFTPEMKRKQIVVAPRKM